MARLFLLRRAMRGIVLALFVALASVAASIPSFGDDTLDIAVIAFNDFHGNLMTPGGTVVRSSGGNGTPLRVPAGGVEYLATLVKDLREANLHHIVVAAGDLIGASPLTSSLLHDEPTIAALDALGLEVSAVGNHEFDHGVAELKRLQHGGCHPADRCGNEARFSGAKFRYLAANVIERDTGKTVFPSYFIKRFDGIPVAFVGVVLRATPSIVVPSGVAGLRFRDEAQSINALVPELRQQGVEAIIVLIHEGGETISDYNDPACADFKGAIVPIVRHLDPAVDAVVSGHTHQPYVCRIDDRLVTQAGSYGRYLTEIHLTLDRRTRDVIATRARNHVVDATVLARDGVESALVDRAQAATAPIANARLASLDKPLSRAGNASGESVLGDLITDAQLAATAAEAAGGAQIALTNPGGVRADLIPRDGVLSYGDLFATQPFGNVLVVMDLTGEQLRRALEQQWSAKSDRARILQVSRGFSYAWDAASPVGKRVLANSLKLNGEAVVPTNTYRIVVNAFLAEGGDGFTVFKSGTRRMGGPLDIDALADYVRAQGKLAVQHGDGERIKRIN